MLKAVIFDFDGTMVDTETNEFRVWEQLFAERNATLPVAEWGRGVGTRNGFDLYAFLERCTGQPADPEALQREYRTRFQGLMEQTGVLPGVEDRLREARTLGLRIGLASSSHRSWVLPYLHRFGLTHYFESIRTADDVPVVKPDPALYRRVLEDFGLEPGEAVAFEDSPNGALAAKRAGLFCVAIPNPITSLLTFGEVDLRVGSLEEVTLAELAARVA